MQQRNNVDDIVTLRPSLSTVAADISSPGNSDQESKGLDLLEPKLPKISN